MKVSISSSTHTILDIEKYNLFTLQCIGTFSPSFSQPGESFSSTLTRNNEAITDATIETSKLLHTVSQRSTVQQNASSGPDFLLYNCTIVFSINGSHIATGSNTTLVVVRGELHVEHYNHAHIKQSKLIIIIVVYIN